VQWMIGRIYIHSVSPLSKPRGAPSASAIALGLLPAVRALIRRLFPRRHRPPEPTLGRDREIEAIARRLSQIFAEGDLAWLDHAVEVNDPEAVWGALRLNQTEWDNIVQDVERLARRHARELKTRRDGGRE
jgi:hypothetical protein